MSVLAPRTKERRISTLLSESRLKGLRALKDSEESKRTRSYAECVKRDLFSLPVQRYRNDTESYYIHTCTDTRAQAYRPGESIVL